MTKEELWYKWGDPWAWAEYNEKFETLESTKKRFLKDLEAWYDSRREKELTAIKNELIKSIEEMSEAFDNAAKNEVEHRKQALTFGGTEKSCNVDIDLSSKTGYARARLL